MDGFLTLSELSFGADFTRLKDMIRICFQREVDEERKWESFVRAKCMQVSERLRYRYYVIRDLHYFANRAAAADAVTYLREIQAYEHEKLEGLRAMVRQVHTAVINRRRYMGRYPEG